MVALFWGSQLADAQAHPPMRCTVQRLSIAISMYKVCIASACSLWPEEKPAADLPPRIVAQNASFIDDWIGGLDHRTTSQLDSFLPEKLDAMAKKRRLSGA